MSFKKELQIWTRLNVLLFNWTSQVIYSVSLSDKTTGEENVKAKWKAKKKKEWITCDTLFSSSNGFNEFIQWRNHPTEVVWISNIKQLLKLHNSGKTLPWLRFFKFTPHRKIYFHATKNWIWRRTYFHCFLRQSWRLDQMQRDQASSDTWSSLERYSLWCPLHLHHHKQKSMQNVYKLLHIRYFIVKMSSRLETAVLCFTSLTLCDVLKPSPELK